MRVSVAICTYRRPARLAAALEQMTRLRIPTECAWELLIVNNDGTLETDAVGERFAGRLPIRILHEAVPGLAYARNRAVAAAQGDYIAWTDDDALVDADWLVAYADAFDRWPDAAVFGGSIVPRFEGKAPAWIRRCGARLRGPFVLREPGAEPAPVQSKRELPFGANYAVRLDVQRRYTYDPSLGRQAERLGLGNEESEVLRAILRAGHTGWWVPAARVDHCVPPERQTLKYVRAYFRAEGEYTAFRGQAAAPARLLMRACAAELRFQAFRRLLPPELWVSDLIAASEAWGSLYARRARAASPADREVPLPARS